MLKGLVHLASEVTGSSSLPPSAKQPRTVWSVPTPGEELLRQRDGGSVKREEAEAGREPTTTCGSGRRLAPHSKASWEAGSGPEVHMLGHRAVLLQDGVWNGSSSTTQSVCVRERQLTPLSREELSFSLTLCHHSFLGY